MYTNVQINRTESCCCKSLCHKTKLVQKSENGPYANPFVLFCNLWHYATKHEYITASSSNNKQLCLRRKNNSLYWHPERPFLHSFLHVWCDVQKTTKLTALCGLCILNWTGSESDESRRWVTIQSSAEARPKSEHDYVTAKYMYGCIVGASRCTPARLSFYLELHPNKAVVPQTGQRHQDLISDVVRSKIEPWFELEWDLEPSQTFSFSDQSLLLRTEKFMLVSETRMKTTQPWQKNCSCNRKFYALISFQFPDSLCAERNFFGWKRFLSPNANGKHQV